MSSTQPLSLCSLLCNCSFLLSLCWILLRLLALAQLHLIISNQGDLACYHSCSQTGFSSNGSLESALNSSVNIFISALCFLHAKQKLFALVLMDTIQGHILKKLVSQLSGEARMSSKNLHLRIRLRVFKVLCIYNFIKSLTPVILHL